MKPAYKEISTPITKAETMLNYVHSDPNNIRRSRETVHLTETPNKYTIDETIARLGDIKSYNQPTTTGDDFNYSQYYVDRQKSRYGAVITDKDAKIERQNETIDKKDKEILALQEKQKNSQQEVINTKKLEGDLGNYVNEMSKEFLDMKEAIIVALEESLEKIQKKENTIEKMHTQYDALEKDYFEEKKVLCEQVKKFRPKRSSSHNNIRKIGAQKNVHK